MPKRRRYRRGSNAPTDSWDSCGDGDFVDNDDAAVSIAPRSPVSPTEVVKDIDQAVVESLKDVIANASKNLARLRAMSGAASNPQSETNTKPRKSTKAENKPMVPVAATTVVPGLATADRRHTELLQDEEVSQNPLSYKIPAKDLSLAMQAPKESPESYWSYRFYRGPEGEEVVLHYCRTREQSEKIARSLLDQEVFGFDMEWEAWKKNGLKNQISLIQLACEREIALFHIALHEGETVDELVAPSLREILESPRILKAGCNVVGADGERLKRYFGIQPRGLFELVQVYRELKYSTGEARRGEKLNCSLANQVQEHLHLPLCKTNSIRCGRWSKPINQKQSDYAASDAYAGFVLYHVMEAKRRKQQALSDDKDDVEAPPDIPQLDGADPRRNIVRKRADDILDPTLQPLFSVLRAWRRNSATQQNLPPYQIAYDRTLKEIARKQPRSMKELKQISGIGEVTATRYGPEWLEIIQEHAPATDTHREGLSTEQSPPATTGTLLRHSGSVLQQLTPANTPEMDPFTRPLYSALCGLRIKLSRDMQTEVYSVALDSTLEGLARHRPRNDLDLSHIHGADNLARKAKQYGVDLFAFMHRHTLTAREDNTRPVLSEVQPPQGHVTSATDAKGRDSADEESGYSEESDEDYFETMSYDTSQLRESYF